MTTTTTGYDDNLLSVAIVEKDSTGDVQLVWCYPSFSDGLLRKVVAQSGLLQSSIPLKFTYNNWNNEWVHIWSANAPADDEDKSAATSATALSIVVVTKQFNPEKYAALCELLGTLYLRGGSPVELLGVYLSVFRQGSWSSPRQDGLEFSDDKYDPRRALLVTSLKDIVRLFADGSILIWTALMTKKRVAVFSERLVSILRSIRGFPTFVWHRQDWNVLRPHVDLSSEQELADLRAAGVYCAGFTDPAIKANSSLWDVLVDIDAREVRVSDQAKGDFDLTGWQRNLAKFMLESADDPDVTPQGFIKALADKTKELLQKLLSLRVAEPDGTQYITWDALQSVKLPPKMDSFLFAVAAAEGYTKPYGEHAASSAAASSSDSTDQ